MVMLRAPEPILTAHRFAPLHEALVALLEELSPADWQAPTVAGAWTVKDVVAHLLDTGLRRLSLHRDGYVPPLAPAESLAAFVNGLNAEAVQFARRLSPGLLLDLHRRYGPELAAFLSSLDPFAESIWGVSWAGEERSQSWFDVARELTERWHHQQQIRDATGRPPLYDGYLPVVLDTFVRALPFTYQQIEAAEGTSLEVRIDEQVWTLVREGAWTLYCGTTAGPTTRVRLRGDRAWRLFTRQKIDPKAEVEGAATLAEPLLRMVAIV